MTTSTSPAARPTRRPDAGNSRQLQPSGRGGRRFALALAGVVGIVSADDGRHELVSHHVAVVEIDETDPRNATQYRLDLDEPRAARRWQVHLSHVAGDHHLRVEP